MQYRRRRQRPVRPGRSLQRFSRAYTVLHDRARHRRYRKTAAQARFRSTANGNRAYRCRDTSESH